MSIMPSWCASISRLSRKQKLPRKPRSPRRRGPHRVPWPRLPLRLQLPPLRRHDRPLLLQALLRLLHRVPLRQANLLLLANPLLSRRPRLRLRLPLHDLLPRHRPPLRLRLQPLPCFARQLPLQALLLLRSGQPCRPLRRVSLPLRANLLAPRHPLPCRQL